jgi:hypothetical protein
MAQEILYESKNLIIGYDSDEGWMYTDWIGYQSAGDIKSGGEKMIECLKAAKATKVLNDNTHIPGMWGGAAEWAGTDWLPRMVEAGLEHFAWVYSPSVLSRISASSAIKAGGEHAEGRIRMFFDMDSAKRWLRSVE